MEDGATVLIQVIQRVIQILFTTLQYRGTTQQMITQQLPLLGLV